MNKAMNSNQKGIVEVYMRVPAVVSVIRNIPSMPAIEKIDGEGA
jgi:hypothetical protein